MKPLLTPDQVSAVVPSAKDVSFLDKGGQKQVFACLLDGKPHVLKFVHLGSANPAPTDDPAVTGDAAAATAARAAREVETMAECASDTLVKLGPLGLQTVRIGDENFLYFSEQRVNGRDLRKIVKENGPLPSADLLRLIRDVTQAVSALWAFAKIHRDIKPGNIMLDVGTGRFILLDAGLVLDLDDESLTATGYIVGTPAYFSPEQMDLPRKRQLDFRSDLFSLGIVAYEMATAQHPFARSSATAQEIFSSIASQPAQAPREIRADVHPDVEAIVMRLLAKRPHLRYRTCEQLLAAVHDATQAVAAATQEGSK